MGLCTFGRPVLRNDHTPINYDESAGKISLFVLRTGIKRPTIRFTRASKQSIVIRYCILQKPAHTCRAPATNQLPSCMRTPRGTGCRSTNLPTTHYHGYEAATIRKILNSRKGLYLEEEEEKVGVGVRLSWTSRYIRD